MVKDGENPRAGERKEGGQGALLEEEAGRGNLFPKVESGVLLAVVCLYFCAQRISTRPALGVPECAGELGVRGERGGLPGLTFQHLDGHFHGSLRMAQAVSRGLHHLPKSPGAQGAAWERDDLSAADPQRI